MYLNVRVSYFVLPNSVSFKPMLSVQKNNAFFLDATWDIVAFSLLNFSKTKKKKDLFLTVEKSLIFDIKKIFDFSRLKRLA